MNITCISTSRIPSDTANGIQVMKACHGLAQMGHAVHLLLPGIENPGWEALADRYGLSAPFQVSWLGGNPRWKRNDFAWAAVRRAVRLRSDLVYTWTGQSAVFGLVHRMPVVFEVHDLPTGRLGPQWFRVFRTLPGRKKLAVITQALLASLQKRYGSLQALAPVIAPNGVDLQSYQGLPDPIDSRNALGLPEAPTVLCSGHLYSGRGAELFLDLAARFLQASFVWVGGRPADVDHWRAFARTKGLPNVTFAGFVQQTQLPDYLAAADILLMPYASSIAGSGGGNSAEICSPMKMFDYLAVGRAILSSDLPVIHEVLNESNAVFAVPEDLASWTEALASLLTNPNRREILAAQAAKDAGMYTWKSRAERVLNGFSIVW